MPTLPDLIHRLESCLQLEQDEPFDCPAASPKALTAFKTAFAETPQASAPRTASVETAATPGPEPDPLPDFASLAELTEAVRSCTRCPLCKTRTQAVPGEGNSDRPDILFIGEGPGQEEDRQGRPFVGRAGQLLDKMIAAMGCRREELYIANIVKCRAYHTQTNKDRPPEPEEATACLPYLKAQIRLIRPKLIISLGRPALEYLGGKKVSISRERGRWRTFEGIDLMPTFHPSYLLRSPSHKKEAWSDLKAALARLGKTPPPRK
jgi:DNA polymerase